MKLMRMIAVAALLAASPLAYGQETDLMSVNVPFAFTAGGVSMPARPLPRVDGNAPATAWGGYVIAMRAASRSPYGSWS